MKAHQLGILLVLSTIGLSHAGAQPGSNYPRVDMCVLATMGQGLSHSKTIEHYVRGFLKNECVPVGAPIKRVCFANVAGQARGINAQASTFYKTYCQGPRFVPYVDPAAETPHCSCTCAGAAWAVPVKTLFGGQTTLLCAGHPGVPLMQKWQPRD